MFKPVANNDTIIDEIRLRRLKFESLTPSEQVTIKSNRSKPDIEILHNDCNTKKFNTKWYDDYAWLWGSKSSNKLYCIACVIYGGETFWACDGIDSIKKFPERANKHQMSKSHIKNMESYVMAGKNRILRENNELVKSAEDVSLRKEILSKIIDAIVVLNRYGKDIELFNEDNKNSVGELIMNKYLCDTSIYKRIYNEESERLIKTMESQLFMDIKKEISKTAFCSILVDEIPSRTNEYSVMVRYIHGGEVKIRFIGFYKIVQIFDLAQIFNTVTGDVRKAICHSYDGSSVIKPLRLGIKTIMPKLLFLPNHLHRINTLLLQNLEVIEEIRSFIRNVTYICDFFKTPNRKHQFKIYGVNLPVESETLWKFNSKSISSIITQQSRILKIINNIILDPYVIDMETVNAAYGIQKILQCPLFLMYSSLFTKVFVHVEFLSNTIQKKLHEDVRICIQEVEQTAKNISNLKTSVFVKQCMDDNKTPMNKIDLTPERIRIFKACASKAVGLMANQILEIFDDIKYLKFIDLLDENKFSSYWNKFPKALFTDSMSFYEGFFNLPRLENELTMIYSDYMKKLNPYLLYCYLHDNGLRDAYQETYKLLQLYLTYPLLPVENCNRGWDKLRNFLNNNENTKKSAMLHVESYSQGSSEYVDFKKTVIQNMS